MKLKLSELKPNPFKKQISKGELNREQVDKIKANIKELGFFGSLPVFKKDSNYYLIAGHHRTQALKEVYGKDWEVQVTISDYNEDQVFRGMVIENVSQRGSKFDEMSQNVEAIENYLNNRPKILEQVRRERIQKKIDEGKISLTIGNRSGGTTQLESDEVVNAHLKKLPKEAVIDDIGWWLDKQSESVLREGVIKQYVSINHNLDEDIKATVDKVHDKDNHGQGTDTTGFTKAYILSTVPKEEQKPLAKVLEETREQRVREQGKLITKYKDAPEEVKEQVKKGAVDLADIDLAITSHNLNEKKKNRIIVEDISKKIDGIISSLEYNISDTEKGIKEVMQTISRLSRFIKDMNEKQKNRTGRMMRDFSGLLKRASELFNAVEDKLE